MTNIVTRAAPIAAVLFKTGLKSLFKPAAIFSVTLLALTDIGSPLRAAEAAPDPAGFDILGMKLGMSVADIQAAIKAYNPSLKIITSQGPSPIYTKFSVGKFVQLVHAERQPPGAFPEYIAVAFTLTQPGRAFYIGRRTTFPLEQQPLTDKTMQQLREKYGPESKSFNDLALNWTFDRAGKQIINPSDPCRGANRTISYGNGHGWFGIPLDAPDFFSPECGIDLRVQLMPGPNAHLLSTLLEELVGHSIAVDDIQKLMAESKAVQEQQRQQQEQKALGVKPPL